MMITILIELSEEQAQQLQRRATDLGISVAELVVVGMMSWRVQPMSWNGQ